MGAGKSADGRAVLVAGVVAGVAATLAQILLWLAAGENVWALLLRDAALTAALVLDQAVRTTPATFDAGIMLAATGIHFALSVIYAAVLLPVAKQLALIPSLLAGAGFGALLYFVNLHGFTVMFPWFVEARGWISLTAHLVFGITVMLIYRWPGTQAFSQ